MAEILVRDVDDAVLRRLKNMAERTGCSLETEVKSILERSTSIDVESARELATRIRLSFGDRTFTDSADLIREDRDR